jgi:phage FluMu protein Com
MITDYKTVYTVKCRNCDTFYKTERKPTVGASCPKCEVVNSHNDYVLTSFVKKSQNREK